MSISSTSSGNSSTSSFNFDGVISGLNTTGIIQAMLAQDQGPLNQLKSQQSTVQARDTAYQSLETQVTALQSSLQTLLLPSNVNAKAVDSTTTAVATATANSGASNGVYALNVDHLATATKVGSSVFNGTRWVNAAIGAGLKDGTEVGPKTAIENAGFATAPTMGTFTINGKQLRIGDVNGNSTGQSLDDIVQLINGTPGIDVQASVTTDNNGQKNFITLHSVDGQPIQLGSGGDTSNFLTAAHLVATGLTTDNNIPPVISADITSSVPLGTANTSATLSSANLGTALTGTTGNFSVNGKSITWDASKDTISTILNKINTSGAGVTAVYDPTNDAVQMTNVATGNQSIALSDDSGGLLAALHLTGGTSQQSLGKTAQFQINGGAWQYSNSNTINNSLPGVSIKLAGPGSTSLSVSQDTDTTIANVQSFVTAFNSLVDAIDKNTAYDASNNTPSLLTGDGGITNFESQLYSMLSNPVPGISGQYTTLASIGVSTGDFGATVGSTHHLVVDTNKLTAALQADPNSVVSVIAGGASATLNPNSIGAAQPGSWISSLSGTPSTSQHGQYKVTVDALGNLSAIFTPDGSTSLAAVTGSISAFGSNSTLIPGLTINASALPGSGSVTDTIGYHQSGILGALNDFLTDQLGSGGIFDTEHTSANSQLASLTSQINDQNTMLAQRQTTLQQQFTAMETALAQIQSQNGSLLASMGVSSTSPTTTSSTSKTGSA